ncbi:hypothetical protein BB560_000355 [Smittium megazygosporum]|uniref:Uncharacterized protein n=1 Tax=Smittium megazygosporum TaxID=133381 RepID=A0A2T9ZKL9_9FUNG|nr:hypothetical protein BB560_000355 [Smittium megazygosporum]
MEMNSTNIHYIGDHYESLIKSSLDQLLTQDALYYSEQYFSLYSQNRIVSWVSSPIKNFQSNLEIPSQDLYKKGNSNYFGDSTLNLFHGISSLYWLSFVYFSMHDIEFAKEIISLNTGFLLFILKDAENYLFLETRNEERPVSSKIGSTGLKLVQLALGTLWLYANIELELYNLCESESILKNLINFFESNDLYKDLYNSEQVINSINYNHILPKLSTLYVTSGQLHIKAKREREAINSFSKALDLDPLCISAWKSLCLLRVGQKKVSNLENGLNSWKKKQLDQFMNKFQQTHSNINSHLTKNPTQPKTKDSSNNRQGFIANHVKQNKMQNMVRNSALKPTLQPYKKQSFAKSSILGQTQLIKPQIKQKKLKQSDLNNNTSKPLGNFLEPSKKRLISTANKNHAFKSQNNNFENSLDDFINLVKNTAMIYLSICEYSRESAEARIKSLPRKMVENNRDLLCFMASVNYEHGDQSRSAMYFNKVCSLDQRDIKGLGLYSSLLWQTKNINGMINLICSYDLKGDKSDVELYIMFANYFSLRNNALLSILSLYFGLQSFMGTKYFDENVNPTTINTRNLFEIDLQMIPTGRSIELDFEFDIKKKSKIFFEYSSQVTKQSSSLEDLKLVSYLYSLMGYELINLNLVKRATSSFVISTQIYRYIYNPYYGLGVLHMNRKINSVAHYYFQKACELNSNNANLNCSMAMLSESEGYDILAYQHYKLAIIASQSVALADPDGKLKDEIESSSLFISQLNSDSFLRFVMFKIAGLYFKKKDFQRCEKILLELLINDPIPESSSVYSIAIENDMGDQSDLQIHYYDILNLLGQSLSNQGKIHAANLCFEQINKGNINDFNLQSNEKEAPKSFRIVNLATFARNVQFAINAFSSHITSATLMLNQVHQINTPSMNRKQPKNIQDMSALSQNSRRVSVLAKQLINDVFT